jgi:ParB/RepB/Spo0J family partition protein
MKLAEINLTDILVGERFREDYGDRDFEELKGDIKERGLIHPIAVQSDDGNPPYRLCAGGRRFLAHVKLGREKIACRVYDRPLTDLEIRAIELAENIHRRDLSHIEQSRLTREIDRLFTQVHGKKFSTSKDAPGWSQARTAEVIHMTPARVSQHIKIAQAAEDFPELELDKCKNEDEARKKFSKFESTLSRKAFAERAQKEMGKDCKNFVDRFIVMDFFEGIKKVPEKSIQLLEIDPPYAIDLTKVKRNHEANYEFNSYNEVAASEYLTFMENVLLEAWRVMAENSWLLLWFGPEPWLEPLYQLLTKTGFKTRRLTAKWIKPNGQTNSPNLYLANCDEQFFYARKGSPILAKPGRSNCFHYAPVPGQFKIHPTERPLDMMREILSTFVFEGSRVAIPFLGSGVTIKACEYEHMYPIGWDLSQTNKDSFISKFYGGQV